VKLNNENRKIQSESKNLTENKKIIIYPNTSYRGDDTAAAASNILRA